MDRESHLGGSHTEGSRSRVDRALSLIRWLVPEWHPTATQTLWTIRIAILLAVLLSIFTLIGDQYGKTIWDAVQLLLTASIPIVIAVVGTRYTYQRAQDDALQAYLDDMTELLVDEKRPLHRAQPSDALSTVARARTITILERLTPDRKRSILQFLYEAGLIYKQRLIVSLDGSDFSHVDLTSMNLAYADLSGVKLRSANLTGAQMTEAALNRGVDLREADLSVATLQFAELIGAKLGNAHCQYVDLHGADLFSADMTNADLSGANLSGAKLISAASVRGADLSYADLSGIEEIEGLEGQLSNEMLEHQAWSVKSTTMPDGSKHA